jgi:hypothetical protein
MKSQQFGRRRPEFSHLPPVTLGSSLVIMVAGRRPSRGSRSRASLNHAMTPQSSTYLSEKSIVIGGFMERTILLQTFARDY